MKVKKKDITKCKKCGREVTSKLRSLSNNTTRWESWDVRGDDLHSTRWCHDGNHKYKVGDVLLVNNKYGVNAYLIVDIDIQGLRYFGVQLHVNAPYSIPLDFVWYEKRAKLASNIYKYLYA